MVKISESRQGERGSDEVREALHGKNANTNKLEAFQSVSTTEDKVTWKVERHNEETNKAFAFTYPSRRSSSLQSE